MSRALLAVAIAVVLAAPSGAEEGRPAALREVGYDQRLGERLPLDLPFRDEDGGTVHLGDYFGTKPVVLVPAYYECPMLCTLVLNGLTSALRAMAIDVGKEFTVVTFSINPAETSTLAATKKAAHLAEYRRPGAAAGWHFLTGDEASIHALASAIGFRYRYDETTKQFAHAAGLVVVTPNGTIARYFFGIEFPPRDLRLALVESSEGKVGSVVDQLLLFCFHWDPASGRYSRVAIGAIRAGAVATLLALATFLVLSLRREARG